MTKEKQQGWTMTAGGLAAAIGLALVVRGAWLAWRPAGWMLAGALIAVPALLAAYSAARERFKEKH